MTRARLLTVINDILDFSKIEAGKLELDPIPFILRRSLAETMRILAVRACEKGLELTCDVRPEVPEEIAGPVRVRQMVVTLLGNAITARGCRLSGCRHFIVRLVPDIQDLTPAICHLPPNVLPLTFLPEMRQNKRVEQEKDNFEWTAPVWS